MISVPLFRVGDIVTVCSDLRQGLYYTMLYDSANHDFVTPQMRRFGGSSVRIARIEFNQYFVTDLPILDWTDTMFVEGNRIAKYLLRGGT